MKNNQALLSLAFVGILSSCKEENNTVTPPVITPVDTNAVVVPATRSIHVELGLPTDADSSDDFIIDRPQYVLSYNKNRNVANWVSWYEDSTWYGPVPRCDCFSADTALPASFTRVVTGDYTGSGYDRSHILGSEARTRNSADNRSTFFMTNIFPQTPTLNQNTWASLEKTCDSLSKIANKSLFIIAGGVYKTDKKVGGKVSVPDSCWKIVVVMDRGQKLENVTSTSRVIAVMMPNITYTKDNNNWELYQTSVKNIENQTGYNFLSYVRKDIQKALEGK